MDAQLKEIKDLCVANGSKDAEIAALKEQLSKLLKDTGLQINEVSKVATGLRFLTGYLFA